MSTKRFLYPLQYTIGSLNVSSATISSLISSNITTNSLLTTSANMIGNVSVGGLISGAMFTGGSLQLSGQGSIASLIATTATIPNIIHTAITTNTLLISNGSLFISTGNANVSGNVSAGGQISGATFTGGSLQISGQSSIANLIATNATIPNIVHTGVTIANTIDYPLIITSTFSAGAGGFSHPGMFLNANLAANEATVINIGQANSGRNLGYYGFVYTSAGSTTSYLTMGLWGIDRILNINGMGNVGIGTTSPQFNLDVNGTLRASAGITTSTLLASTSISTGQLAVTNITASNIQVTGSFNPTNINTTNITTSTIQVTGTFNPTNINTTNITISTAIITNNLKATFNSNTIGNIFTTGGNVGIGTTSPSSTITIFNTTTASSSTAAAGGAVASFIGQGGSGSVLNVDFSTYLNISQGNAVTPTARLSFLDDGSFGGSINLLQKSTGSITNGLTSRFFISTIGRIGISTTVPAYTLDVNGTFNAGNSNFLNINAVGTTHTIGSAITVNGTNVTVGGTINTPGSISSNNGSVLSVSLNPSGNSNPGYLALFNSSGTRVGYVGWAIGNTLELNSGNGFTGWTVTGTLTVTGELSKGSGSFRIPHPILPQKDLVHSFIEGPRADLIYRGKATLVNGIATIDLNKQCTGNGSVMADGTFEVLCRDPQVFLQNNTTWDKIRGYVDGCILTIESENTSGSNSVEWQVIAERQDMTVKNWTLTDSNGQLILEHDSVIYTPPPDV